MHSMEEFLRWAEELQEEMSPGEAAGSNSGPELIGMPAAVVCPVVNGSVQARCAGACMCKQPELGRTMCGHMGSRVAKPCWIFKVAYSAFPCPPVQA